MPIHRNPVVDKTRGARKRYGARAALWGLLTALYAAGRDHEGRQLRDELLGGCEPDDVLDQALRLPDLGRTGEGLVGWAAHRYHLAERSGDPFKPVHLERLLPRAAYSVMEWSQRTRPRPNLFDMSVDEAYEQAKAFIDSLETKGPRQGPVVFQFDDGWTVQGLHTKALLVDEGNRQHICVGQEQHGYPQRVADGEIKIYSLRDAEGRPHVTMTWSEEDGLYEASGKNNDKIFLDDLRARIKRFALSLGMDEEQAERKLGPLCKKAQAIAASFSPDSIVMNLTREFYCVEYADDGELLREDYIEHPIMRVDEFRKLLEKDASFDKIARDLCQGDDAMEIVYRESLNYFEAAVETADRVKRTLKEIADAICEGIDPSKTLAELIHMEHMFWGEECRQTREMNDLIVSD